MNFVKKFVERIKLELAVNELVKKKSKIRDILLEGENFSFYSCNFVFVELFKHKEKLLKLTHNKEEILTSLEVILKRITLINEETISLFSRKRAYKLVK